MSLDSFRFMASKTSLALLLSAFSLMANESLAQTPSADDLAQDAAEETPITIASPAELETLVESVAEKLNDCAMIKSGGPVEIRFVNKTGDSIDKKPLIKMIAKTIKATATPDAKLIRIEATLHQTQKIKGREFETSYLLRAKAVQAKTTCERSETFLKSGTR